MPTCRGRFDPPGSRRCPSISIPRGLRAHPPVATLASITHRIEKGTEMRMRSLTVGATVAVLLALTPAAVSVAPAHADCGDPGQPACAGPIPSPDQVVAVLAELTDPGRPAASKSDVVTPGFSPEEAQTIDDHMKELSASGVLPLNFVVADIQPAPGNFAGVLVGATGSFPPNHPPGTCGDGQPGRALAGDPRHRMDRSGCVLGQRQPSLPWLCAPGGKMTLLARGVAHPFRYRTD